MPISKWLFLNNLGFKMLGRIQNLVPHRLDVAIKTKDHYRRHSSYLGHTAIDVWIQKMDIDGDGGRPEFGLRGQRRGTESDKKPPQFIQNGCLPFLATFLAPSEISL
jgi:hypothetical protein